MLLERVIGNSLRVGGARAIKGDDPHGGPVHGIEGGRGADRLNGGEGRNTLAGGLGADRLEGGSEADRFVFGGVSDSSAGARDTVRDFDRAEGDRIELSGIDAIAGGNDDRFTFVTGAFIEPGQAEAILTQGKADLVALGRQLMAESHWLYRAAEELGAADPADVLPRSYSFYLKRRASALERTDSSGKPV